MAFAKHLKSLEGLWGGSVVAAAITALIALSLWQLWHFGGGSGFAWNAEITAILRFSLWQAGVSAVLSLLLGLMLGRAYVRRAHLGYMRYLSFLLSASFLLPVIVIVFALIAVHGTNGWVNRILNGESRYIYGFSGIVIAHVFFNAPLAARLIAQSLAAIPPQHWQIAQQLGLTQKSAWQRFKLIEYPYIKPMLWSAAALIFLLCFTSFAIVLILGGGLMSTPEVAIYQALRLQFQPTQAAFLALIQIAICLTFATLLLAFGKATFSETPWRKPIIRPDARLPLARINDTIALTIAAALILPPLAAIAVAAIPEQAHSILFTTAFAKALKGSLIIAPSAALIAVAMACAMATASRHVKLKFKSHMLGVVPEIPSFLILITPPLTLSAGLFLLFYKFGWYGHGGLAFGVVILVNALMALPFATHILAPALYRIGADHNKLAIGLGLRGMRRWQTIELPLLQKPLGLALGVSAALSVGDVSAIALFGTQDFTTLPLLLYRLLGAYRTIEAGAVGAALCVIVALLFGGGFALAKFIALNSWRKYNIK